MRKIALNESIKDEKGQVLVLAVILLLVGSLIIASLLGFMSTGLIAGQVFEKKMDGLYAADAGVEDALWQLINDPPSSYPYPYSLPDVNGMSVSVVIEEVTTLYGVFVGGGGVHEEWFDLESEFLGYDGDETWGIYNYRLSLTNKKVGVVKIYEIAVGYSAELDYLSGLVDEDVAGLKGGSFADGIPTETEVSSNKTLAWEFEPPRPEIYGAGDPDDPDTWVTVSCTFQLEGPPGFPGISAYVVMASTDIGTVWEYKPFRITATAQADDESTVVIEAGVLNYEGGVSVGSWQIE